MGYKHSMNKHNTPHRFVTDRCHNRQGRLLFRTFLIVTAAATITFDAAAQAPTRLTFQLAENKTFSFDTGQLHGQLRTKELAFGLFNLEKMPAGTSLSGRHGLMNVYRVFSDGIRYGDAGWGWPSQVKRLEDGAVVIECPADASRPFMLRGIYRWHGPTTLDLEIQVLPQRTLHGFEVFLASYFDPSFSSCQTNVHALPGDVRAPGFMAAKKSLGDWLMFPRDAAAVKLIQDGRWKLLPHPVQWKIMPRLERPLAVRRERDGKTTLLVMARQEDCFAIAMPYETEGHFSVYLSLFGRDLPAGKQVVARTRLQVLDASDEARIIECFQAFAKQTRDHD